MKDIQAALDRKAADKARTLHINACRRSKLSILQAGCRADRKHY